MVTIRRVVSIVFLSLLLVVLGFLATGLYLYYAPLVDEDRGVQFNVREGQSFTSVLEDLKNQDIVKHPVFFSFLVHLRHADHHLKAGEYQFSKGATASKIITQMMTGAGLVQHPFTIIAGWNFKQVRDALNREDKLRHSIQNLTDQQVMALLGYPNLNPEGQFYPDTYYFIRDSQDIKVLKRAFKQMQDKLNVVWQQRLATLPYHTAYEVLIAASLIEKEAHFNQERPIISGVIINRLNKQMLLQIDPTVIYGLGALYDGKIYKKDLLKKTPYNTYVNKGLPPTPIAMPGWESLNAAVHPDNNEYLYYVARGDGYHQFSKTLVEHNKAVNEVKKIKQSYFNKTLLRKYMNQTVSVQLAMTDIRNKK